MESQNNTIQNSAPVVPKQSFWKELLVFIIIAIAIVGIFRKFISPYTIEPFIVVGASMDPTFKTGQYLVVDNFTYHFREDPQREDVIILRYPRDPSTYFIKRIIGLPGETLTMKNGVITITNKEHPEGMTIDDPHVIAEHKTSDNFSITLRDTEYFVMGDNRPESSDSRMWGPLEKKYIVGRPLFRLFPFTTIAAFPGKSL